MKHVAMFGALLLLASPCMSGVIVSDFEDGTLQGWTPYGTFGGRLEVQTGGHPGYCMVSLDTTPGGGGLCVSAPAQFNGDLTGYTGLTWDVFVPDNGATTTQTPYARLSDGLGTMFVTSSLAPSILGTWTTVSAPFDSAHWTRSKGTADFQSVLTNATLAIETSSTARSDNNVESMLDNITLVPEPATLLLMFLGGLLIRRP